MNSSGYKSTPCDTKPERIKPAITGHNGLQMLRRYTHLRAVDLAKMLGKM